MVPMRLSRSIRRRSKTGPLFLEPLEDRQLLSGITQPSLVQWVMPPEQGTKTVTAVVQSDTPPAANPQPTPDYQGAVQNTGPTAGGGQNTTNSWGPQQGTNTSAAGTTGTPSPSPSGSSNPPAGSTPSVNDPTPNDTYNGTGSNGTGPSTTYQTTSATGQDPGEYQTADPTAQQTDPSHGMMDSSNAAYQANPNAQTNQAYEYRYYEYEQQVARAVRATQESVVSVVSSHVTSQPSGQTAPEAQNPTPGRPPEPVLVEANKPSVEPMLVVHLQREPDQGVPVPPARPTELAQENPPDAAGEERAETSAARLFSDPSALLPQRGDLLPGTLPVDLPTLERAVVGFFARLENLAEDVAAWPATQTLAQWLVAGATAAGAFEFARRRLHARSSGPVREDGEAGPNWAPFPILAVLPPEDES
jgi:hypothetical protein